MSTYEKRMMTKEGKLTRIAEIDADFEAAERWGSWMAEASNERRSLVERLKKYDGVDLPHKYEFKTSGGKVINDP